jgi:hypothetical protein
MEPTDSQAWHALQAIVCELPRSITRDVAKHLIKIGYIVANGHGYSITADGMEYYEAVSKNPTLIISGEAWKDEALTGITKSGRRSKIEGAALPKKSEIKNKSDKCPSDARIDASNALGMTIEEFEKVASA